MVRGEVAEIIQVRVHDRETPFEHFEYDAETAGGAVVRVREDAAVRHQQQLF